MKFLLIMATMISYGNELLRISPKNNSRLEYSKNGGTSWNSRCTSSSYGEFIDLLQYGSELLAVTSKGIYYSKNAGISWNSRYTSSSCGTFMSLQDGGGQLLAQTTKGLYYSKNGGISWWKK